MAFQYCIGNQIFETYLTHYRKQDDRLIPLIEEYGFELVGFLEERKENKEKEEVYLKKFIPIENDLSSFDLAKKFYPSFNHHIWGLYHHHEVRRIRDIPNPERHPIFPDGGIKSRRPFGSAHNIA